MNIDDSWTKLFRNARIAEQFRGLRSLWLEYLENRKDLGVGGEALKLNGYLLSNVLYSNESIFPVLWTVILNNVWVHGLKTPQEGHNTPRSAQKWDRSMPYPQNCMRPWFPWNRQLKAVHSSTRWGCGSCQCLKKSAVTHLFPNNMAQMLLPQICIGV